MPIIINGGSRGAGGWWSKHLGNAETNERVEVLEYRDLSATDMREAFREMEALAVGTKCDNYFYQANINPRADEVLTPAQWREAVDTLERNLGLTGQPRFVVQHEKEGRVHQHVVWSRIDVENGVAISDSLTARIHESTSRELEIKFDLEHGKSILVPDRDFDRPDRRPKKWETFRGAQTGIDPEEMKAELSALRQRCDSGISFRAALEESGAYVLARGDRRDYVIIDREGDVHSLARRTDLRVAELRRFMADLDPASVPSVDQAKALQHDRHRDEHNWDRDRANADWESQIQNAALGANIIVPKTEAGVASIDAKDAPAARGAYAELREEPAPEARKAPAIGKSKSDISKSDIRAALAAAQDADPTLAAEKLQAELKNRGIGLAAVTAEEAYASERAAAFAGAVGNRSRPLGEGEIVAVDGRGNAYRLDERVTGQPRRATAEQLAGIDRDQLPNLEAAKDAMRAANKAAWRAERDEERAQARINEPVAGTVAEIRMAFALAPDGPNATPLQEALAARGMTLARATGAEAAASQQQADLYMQRRQEREQAAATSAEGRYAELKPPVPEAVRYAPRLNEGEIVVIDGQSHIHKLDERSTGLRHNDIGGRLAGLEDLLTVTDAQAAMRDVSREAWIAERVAAREKTREPNAIESRIAECARRAELDGAHIRVDAHGERVRGAEALADRLRPEEEQKTMPIRIHGPEAFAVRLEDAGIALVRVTEADAKALRALGDDKHLERLAAETNGEAYQGRHIDACEAGDLAAVTRFGDVYRINPGKIGMAAHSLAGELPGVIETRAQFESESEQKGDIWLQTRLAAETRRDERETLWQERADIAEGRRAADNTARTIEAATDTAVRGVGKLLRSVARMLEGIFDFLVPPPRLTPAQAELAERAAEERNEARAAADAVRRAEAEREWQTYEEDRRRQQEELAIRLGLATAQPPQPSTELSRDAYDRDRY